MEKDVAFHLNKLEWSLPNADFCYLWIKLAQWVWRRYKNFVIHVCYFFFIISPWKRVGSFIETNYLQPRMPCVKFGWNWPSGYGDDFQISSMNFRYFFIKSPRKGKGMALHLDNLNPLHPQMPCFKLGWNWYIGSGEDENVKRRQRIMDKFRSE